MRKERNFAFGFETEIAFGDVFGRVCHIAGPKLDLIWTFQVNFRRI